MTLLEELDGQHRGQAAEDIKVVPLDDVSDRCRNNHASKILGDFNRHCLLPPNRPRRPRTPFPGISIFSCPIPLHEQCELDNDRAPHTLVEYMSDLSSQASARAFLIADDHPMVRDALSTALAHAFPRAAVALAGSFAEVQAALERQPETDALLLDLDMPGMDGLTGLALLRSDWPTVPIIVVSAVRDAV